MDMGQKITMSLNMVLKSITEFQGTPEIISGILTVSMLDELKTSYFACLAFRFIFNINIPFFVHYF